MRRNAPPHRNGRRRRFLVAAVVFVLFAPILGDLINAALSRSDGCRVLGVIDGDTVRMHCPISGLIEGRLLAFDAPELASSFPSEFFRARAAKHYLRWLLWSGSEISARVDGRDRYGRALTLLLVDGQGVARPMVDAGLARWYDGGRRVSWCE